MQTFWNKHWAKVLAVVIVFGILGFIGINKLIIYNQKQQFDAAEVSLDKLYNEITTQVGQPTDVKKDKSCSYSSVEIGRGRLGCSIAGSLRYDSEDAKSSQKLYENIHNIVASLKTFKIKNIQQIDFVNGISSMNNSNPTMDIVANSSPSLNCYLTGVYYDKADVRNYPTIEKNYLEINYGCAGHPKAEFYPVKN